MPAKIHEAAGEAGADRLEFDLNPALDIAGLAAGFAATGRLQIADFLTAEAATGLRLYLEQSDRWRHLFNSAERSYEVPGADWDSTPEPKRQMVVRAIDEAAAYDFQYQYDTIRVADGAAERALSNSPLDRFAHFLSSPAVLGVLMEITASNDLVFADCQATRYRAGDFLTPHNDELDGMNRRFAYVLSLTGDWLPRWGGLLHFVDHRRRDRRNHHAAVQRFVAVRHRPEPLCLAGRELRPGPADFGDGVAADPGSGLSSFRVGAIPRPAQARRWRQGRPLNALT